ncbi:MAG: hypothetical protein NW220_06950 [Leptolyngbyaceae cyanobacterium bins.349]|nr:hypothetical protein [Leptolyngbyaceae cyanobacterium bins.349]
MPEDQPPTPDSHEVEPHEASQRDASLPDVPADQETDPDQIIEVVSVPPDATPRPTVPVAPAQSQTLHTLQQFWQRTQPRLKTGTIRVLKTTIQLLEGAVNKLEAGTDAIAPDADPASTAPLPLPDWASDFGKTAQRSWQRFWNGWNGVLPKIRGILPASINQALSDRALSGAIAGILVLVLWIGSSLLSSQPPKQVAVVPPTQPTPAKPTPAKQQPEPKQAPQVKVIPPPKPEVKASPKPSPNAEPVQPLPSPTAATPKPSPSPSVQPSPTVSPTPSPSPTPTPIPPSPPLKLTPEQTLIARIQDQVAEVSDQYVSGLIQSVQANFRSSRLLVKVGTGWYSLLPTQQDSLANDILQRAQQLNFVKLELLDPDSNLLARSPVVGSEMVVLQRSRSSGSSSPYPAS